MTEVYEFPRDESCGLSYGPKGNLQLWQKKARYLKGMQEFKKMGKDYGIVFLGSYNPLSKMSSDIMEVEQKIKSGKNVARISNPY